MCEMAPFEEREGRASFGTHSSGGQGDMVRGKVRTQGRNARSVFTRTSRVVSISCACPGVTIKYRSKGHGPAALRTACIRRVSVHTRHVKAAEVTTSGRLPGKSLPAIRTEWRTVRYLGCRVAEYSGLRTSTDLAYLAPFHNRGGEALVGGMFAPTGSSDNFLGAHLPP